MSLLELGQRVRIIKSKSFIEKKIKNGCIREGFENILFRGSQLHTYGTKNYLIFKFAKGGAKIFGLFSKELGVSKLPIFL